MRTLGRESSISSPEHDRGQATVELALAMPLLCLLLLAVVQLAVLVAHQLTVLEAARRGGRAAAVSADPAGAVAAALTSGYTQDGLETSTSTSPDGRYVSVTVTMVDHTDVPLIGFLLPDVELVGTSTMLLEPP